MISLCSNWSELYRYTTDTAEVTAALGDADIACKDEVGGCNTGILIIRVSQKMYQFFRNATEIVEMGFWDQGTMNYLLKQDHNANLYL